MRNAPLTKVHTSEALRMALGLTLSDHRVSVLYLGDGAYHALDIKPEVISQPGIKQSIELFVGMKVKQWVEQEALESWALPLIRKDVQPFDQKKALEMIQQAEVVVSF